MVVVAWLCHRGCNDSDGDGGCGGGIGDNIGSGSSSGSNMVVVAAVDWWYRI